MSLGPALDPSLDEAAAAIRSADALVVTAGAGMGVDSGLPDFRGPQGFWRAYPAYKRLGLRFEELANPTWFRRDPALAWGFYGHRLNLYRATVPHRGFEILRGWIDAKPGGGFVFTSNVDGHFQRAGYPEGRVVECHGSLNWLQCRDGCGHRPWPAEAVGVTVDPESFRAQEPFPDCPSCGGLARPNVLMFGDWEWEGERTEAQERLLETWLAGRRGALAIIECGAGTGVPTVRLFGERLLRMPGVTLIRVNPTEPQVPRTGAAISLPSGALAALEGIEASLAR